MSNNQKRSGTPLIMIAVILLIAGVSVMLIPILVTDTQLSHDTEEYDQLGTQFRIANTEQPLKEVAVQALEPNQLASIEISPEDAAPSPTFLSEGKTHVDLAACKAANGDFIAWLQIPNTSVDYPVVWTNDIDYYLNHTFAGKKSYLGTLFSLKKTDYSTPSKNIAVYGHHIRSNDHTMFSPLLSYKTQSYYEGNETIYFDTLYYSGTYTIFAVINMRDGDWDQSLPNFSSDQDFLAFVNQARSQSLYKTGVEVTADDQILTLITCDRAYIPKDGRLVIMAVKQ